VKLIGDKWRVSATDIANFPRCLRLPGLDERRARGELSPANEYDAAYEDLVRRGEAHEQRVLQGFRDRGWSVVEIMADREDPASLAAGAAATKAALDSGVDVIYQGVLIRDTADEQLLGLPDFMVRAGLLAKRDGEPRPPVYDRPDYEVVDAKLARSAKGPAVTQTTFYSALLADQQGGVAPKWLHLALGTGELASFKVADYAAYERQIRKLLTEFLKRRSGPNPPADHPPRRVEHCTVCRWSTDCQAQRRADGDLSLVAGMTGPLQLKLIDAGIGTLRGLAATDPLPPVPGTSRESLERVRSQAILQVASEDTGSVGYKLLDPAVDPDGGLIPNRGLLALPEPVAGDLFFDIEGARFYSEDNREFGLQYLFGIVDTADLDAGGVPRYRQFWAFDRAGEKQAFEELIDFITARRAERPGMHVYHYNHYETTTVDHLSELHETREEAVGRLMGRFATREDEVDELFRLGVFVDLYRVVRQGLRAGVESYSIKKLEALCGYTREVELGDATEALVSLEAAIDEGSAAGETVLRQEVGGYNEDDCRAMIPLRDWLESLRPELAAQLGLASAAELPRPVVIEADREPDDSEAKRLREALQASIPARPSARTPEQAAVALLADLLEWHRRENKPAWRRHFDLRTLDPHELVGEPDALGLLTGGVIVGSEKRSVLRRFSFPPQEHKFAPGDTAHDAVTGRSWPVYAVDDAHGHIVLKVSKDYEGPLPDALVPAGPPKTDLQADRLRDLGVRVLADGLSGLDAATALLLRRPPAGESGEPLPLRLPGQSEQDAAVRVALALRSSYLPIQGPPGSGKTHSAAEQILALVGDGRTVAITGPSHAAIYNVIDAVLKHAADRGVEAPRIGQRADEGNPSLHAGAQSLSYRRLKDGLTNGDLDVVAGTPWMLSRPEFQGSVDTLIVDEAGQMSLADVLAMAGSARNVILLGDPQQLAKPSQATHPPGSEVSALQHVLGPDRETIADDAGLLYRETRRLPPDLCQYTSEMFYDSKLTPMPGLDRQAILGDPPLAGAGLRAIEVPHEGNTQSSTEEAAKVVELVQSLLGRQWRDRHGELATIGVGDIMVVTPYNAQIRVIQAAAAEAGLPRLNVGTVDKFQGREAPVVIYSMATSSPENAPRGMEFLYDRHRLNVATSRARALAIIVASPALLRVGCKTPMQMRMANALIRAFEVSRASQATDRSSPPAPREPRRTRPRLPRRSLRSLRTLRSLLTHKQAARGR
jgi:predicted RecB family nuclease